MTRRCLLSSLLVDKVVLRIGSMLEERAVLHAANHHIPHQEILHTEGIEMHRVVTYIIYSQPTHYSKAIPQTSAPGIDEQCRNARFAIHFTMNVVVGSN